MSADKQRRPRHPMPDDVAFMLESTGLTAAYAARPPYQQNDYIGWIEEARREVTRRKRIRQMIEELESGDVYMNMEWRAGGTKR